jgi:Bifunctional DNA primase/polymerase, N-terminal/AAA domain
MSSERPIDPNCPNNGALYMIERGLYVFPLKRNSKDPKFKGWQTACRSITAESVTSYMGRENWGVHPGPSGHFVIDIDIKNGKVGDKTWAALCLENGGAPKTFTVQTPTKGLHLYFQGNVEGNSALGLDIDVRTAGGYVVAPGSEIDGKMYKVIDPCAIAKAPQWLLDALGNRASKPAVETIAITEIDKPEEVKRAIAYLKDAEPAIEGNSGDATTLKVALGVRDLGMSEDKCFELILEHYNPRCIPPWDNGGLRLKVENAYKYAQNSLGARTVEAACASAVEDFDAVPMPPPEDTAAPSAKERRIEEILAAGEYRQDSPPPRTEPVLWIQGTGIAKRGDLVVIQAKPKVGKSAAIGAAMASIVGEHGQGHDYLGWKGQNPEGWPVLHFDTEQSPEDHYDLIERTLDRAGLSKKPTLLRSFCLTSAGVADALAAILHEAKKQFREHGGIAAIFIDGVGDLCTDPNDPKESNKLVAELYTLSIQCKCPVIVVLHENPSSETGKTRGHLGSQLERKAASNLRLEKNEKGVTQLWSERLRRGHIAKGDGPAFTWSDERKMHVSTISEKAVRELEKEQAISEEKEQFLVFLRAQPDLAKQGDAEKAKELNRRAFGEHRPFGYAKAEHFIREARKYLADGDTEFRLKKSGSGTTSYFVIERLASRASEVDLLV